jgi:hypothetical protein
MCFVRGVGFRVIEHRVHDRNKRLQPDESGKNRPVSNFAVKDENGPLGAATNGVGGVRSGARLSDYRTGAFETPFGSSLPSPISAAFQSSKRLPSRSPA